VDHRADLFSLGVLAYELYLGRKPFDAKTIPQFSEMARNHHPIEPRKLDKGFPEQLQDVLAMLLKKDPDRRFQSARQVVEAFNVFFEGTIAENDTAKCDRQTVKDWA
jgi:serine/threonine-protein kinase